MHAASEFVLAGSRVLVTGASGFIGSVVARQLCDAGARVRCLLRPTSNADRLRDVPFERVDGDVRDGEAIRRALGGCEAAVHLAGLSSWSEINSPAMEEVTLGGTRNVVEAAAALGIRKVIFTSTAAAINGSDRPRVFDESAAFDADDRDLAYSRHKRAAERVCLDAASRGLPVVIVNPTEVYGPGDTALVTAGSLVDFAKSSPVFVCSGGTSVAYVDDVALGILRALERGRSGERYILGGENLTVKDLATLTLDLLGQKKSIVTLPNAMVRGVARGAVALGVPLPFNPLVIPYATRYWFMDSSKATRELGVRFRPAREALAPTLGWLRETGRIS